MEELNETVNEPELDYTNEYYRIVDRQVEYYIHKLSELEPNVFVMDIVQIVDGETVGLATHMPLTMNSNSELITRDIFEEKKQHVLEILSKI